MLSLLRTPLARTAFVKAPLRNSLFRSFSSTVLRADEPVAEKRDFSKNPPYPIVFCLGIPPTGQHFLRRTSIIQILQKTLSPYGSIVSIMCARQSKNHAWVEFETVNDALNLIQAQAASPIKYEDREIRIFYSTYMPPRVPMPTVTGTELTLRFKTATISVNEAIEVVKDRFPQAEVTTNVKTTTGHHGTLFLRFQSTPLVQEAFAASRASPVIFSGQAVTLYPHETSSTEFIAYNLPFAASKDELRKVFGAYGKLTILRNAFEQFGPLTTGRAIVGYSTPEEASELFRATLDEQVKVGGWPVRAEYARVFKPSVPEDINQDSN